MRIRKITWEVLLPVAALWGANLLFYQCVLTEQFIWDDLVIIYAALDLPSIRDAFALDVHRTLHETFHTYHYRPLLLILTKVLLKLFGMNLYAWHLLMLVVHLINTTLVFLFMRRSFSSPILAIGCSLLWSLGYYKTSAVMWLSASHIYSAHLLLWMLVLSPHLKGLAGLTCRVTLLILAALFHETAWLFAFVLLFGNLWIHKAPAQETLLLGACFGFFAIGFSLVYYNIAATTSTLQLTLNPTLIARNMLPLLSSLLIPFHLVLTPMSHWYAPSSDWPLILASTLPLFWIALLVLALLLLCTVPRILKPISRDRLLLWGFIWSTVCLIPNAMASPWISGNLTYFHTVGWVLLLGRFFTHWVACLPKRKQTMAWVATAAVLFVSQSTFSFKVRAHMVQVHHKVFAMLEDLRLKEPSPRPGETWVITHFPTRPHQWRALFRHLYGVAPALRVYPGKAKVLPRTPYRLFKFNYEASRLVRLHPLVKGRSTRSLTLKPRLLISV